MAKIRGPSCGTIVVVDLGVRRVHAHIRSFAAYQSRNRKTTNKQSTKLIVAMGLSVSRAKE